MCALQRQLAELQAQEAVQAELQAQEAARAAEPAPEAVSGAAQWLGPGPPAAETHVGEPSTISTPFPAEHDPRRGDMAGAA